MRVPDLLGIVKTLAERESRRRTLRLSRTGHAHPPAGRLPATKSFR